MVDTRFINSTVTARRLGVPQAWLKREAREGRLPHLRAGRRLLFDPDAVAEALARRTHPNNQAKAVTHG